MRIACSLVPEQEGGAPRVLETGTNFIIPAGVVYAHTNRGAANARMHATYVLDRTKALTRAMHAGARQSTLGINGSGCGRYRTLRPTR